ncbi:hypothetical protein CCH79_00003015 [Gambusia affinis]|uniref:Uncharacterized protein n=1 Tax=Gambusia affinis TaxID=33528 RepID=A0A315VEP7_GAMAF|nr:hypothetical protein CCH79_00003015 [Gambusia affinis]
MQTGSSKSKVILVKEALSKLSKQQYSIEELTGKPLPEGVDPLRLEDYLRFEFNALPNWKQKNLKKSKVQPTFILPSSCPPTRVIDNQLQWKGHLTRSHFPVTESHRCCLGALKGVSVLGSCEGN